MYLYMHFSETFVIKNFDVHFMYTPIVPTCISIVENRYFSRIVCFVLTMCFYDDFAICNKYIWYTGFKSIFYFFLMNINVVEDDYKIFLPQFSSLNCFSHTNLPSIWSLFRHWSGKLFFFFKCIIIIIENLIAFINKKVILRRCR